MMWFRGEGVWGWTYRGKGYVVYGWNYRDRGVCGRTFRDNGYLLG